MIKALTKVGNSHAVIIPAHMIIKYKLGKKIMVEETENGILIHAIHTETSFQKKFRKLRENKDEVKRQLREAAADPEAQTYYANPKNLLGDIDPDFID